MDCVGIFPVDINKIHVFKQLTAKGSNEISQAFRK